MREFFEASMMITFGLSWPFNIINSYRARTTRGKSLLFLILVEIGYICGIIAKFIGHDITIVLLFYVINLLMITADLCLYVRNYKLDKLASV